jgi:hypothetical protein
MKKTWVYSMLVCCIFFFTISVAVSAEESEERDRLEAKIRLGVMFINSGNNLNPYGSKAYLNDLNSAADKESMTIPLILPDVTYDIGDQDGVKLYFNTEPPIDEVGGFVINFGGSYPIENVGIIDINAFFTPFEEVWENPYITGVDRQTTRTSRYGARVAFNRILGTGLRVNVVYMNDDVDEDVIGKLMPELSRDGAVYALNANYSFNVTKTFELRPRMSIRKGEYDGDSNSFTKFKMDLEARYIIGRLALIPRIFYSCSEYDEINPIFNKPREDDGYGISLMANYTAPFGWQNWSTQAMAGFSRGDSNITFYDSEAINLGAFLTYHF